MDKNKSFEVLPEVLDGKWNNLVRGTVWESAIHALVWNFLSIKQESQIKERYELEEAFELPKGVRVKVKKKERKDRDYYKPRSYTQEFENTDLREFNRVYPILQEAGFVESVSFLAECFEMTNEYYSLFLKIVWYDFYEFLARYEEVESSLPSMTLMNEKNLIEDMQYRLLYKMFQLPDYDSEELSSIIYHRFQFWYTLDADLGWRGLSLSYEDKFKTESEIEDEKSLTSYYEDEFLNIKSKMESFFMDLKKFHLLDMKSYIRQPIEARIEELLAIDEIRNDRIVTIALAILNNVSDPVKIKSNINKLRLSYVKNLECKPKVSDWGSVSWICMPKYLDEYEPNRIISIQEFATKVLRLWFLEAKHESLIQGGYKSDYSDNFLSIITGLGNEDYKLNKPLELHYKNPCGGDLCFESNEDDQEWIQKNHLVDAPELSHGKKTKLITTLLKLFGTKVLGKSTGWSDI